MKVFSQNVVENLYRVFFIIIDLYFMYIEYKKEIQ